MAWTCHAKPAALSGKTCGHVNLDCVKASSMGGIIEYCQSCGCTKIASDARERESYDKTLRKRRDEA